MRRGGARVQPLACLGVYAAVVGTQYVGARLHPLTGEERLLCRHARRCLGVAVGHQTARGVDILVGQVRVLALQTELFEQGFQLVHLEVRLKQTYEPQRVEVHGAHAPYVGYAAVAAQVVGQYVVVEVGVVAQQRCVAHVFEKLPQRRG